MRIAPLAALVAGAAAVLITAGCSAQAASPSAPEHPTGEKAPKGHKDAAGHGVRGTVTAENGTTWTVTTAKNATVTVTLTPQTAFGTAKDPSTADRFPVGSQVRVSGSRSGSTVTANRISAPAHPVTPAPAAPGPTA